MALIDVPPHEQGVTRVFALSMTADAARQLRDDPDRQRALIGDVDLDPRGVEVFALADLGAMGLVGYLREGVDAQESDLARDGEKLAALDGWVMLLHSSAFPKTGLTTLRPAPQLTLVGTYAQQAAAPPDAPLESEAAQPYTRAQPEVLPPTSRRLGSVWLILVVLLISLVLFWRALS